MKLRQTYGVSASDLLNPHSKVYFSDSVTCIGNNAACAGYAE